MSPIALLFEVATAVVVAGIFLVTQDLVRVIRLRIDDLEHRLESVESRVASAFFQREEAAHQAFFSDEEGE